MSNNKTYIIAEVGPNHNGDLELALELIEKLSKIGVDAVKFQISNPENAYSLDAFKPEYQKKNDASKSPIEMSKKYQLAFEDHQILYSKCNEYNVDYLCSAFEMDSLQFLNNNFNLTYFKIASGELLTVDMLEYISKQNRPILLSTGMAEYEEVKKALTILDPKKQKEITILHCISSYPADPSTVNMSVMLELKKRFGYQVGFSDHTLGNEAAILAVSLGAKVIEKHVTLDQSLPGPDHKSSATIEEFADLVTSLRKVEKMMGTNKKVFSKKEVEIRKAARKSIVSKYDLEEGHILKKEDFCFKRPGFGIKPIDQNEIIGKKIKHKIAANRVIKPEDLV